MNKTIVVLLVLALFTINSVLYAADRAVAPAANGIQLPKDYQDWKVIGTSHRTDNNSLRVIVGNEIAVTAARSGLTKPWPKGTILGKLVWKDSQHPDWAAATVPGALLHIEFMFKDAVKYRKTGGWGYARWVGDKAIPYGKDAGFARECYECHTTVKSHDYVFTRPVTLP